jgi:hypothetical protein
VEAGSLQVQGQSGQKVSEILSEKGNKNKKAGGIAQVVEWLPSKHKFNPQYPKPKANKQR